MCQAPLGPLELSILMSDDYMHHVQFLFTIC